MAILHALYVSQSPQIACLFVCLSQISTNICSQHIFPFALYFCPSHTLTDWPDFSIHSFCSKQNLSSRCRKLGLSGPTQFGSKPGDVTLWLKRVCWLSASRDSETEPTILGPSVARLSAEAAVMLHDDVVLSSLVKRRACWKKMLWSTFQKGQSLFAYFFSLKFN